MAEERREKEEKKRKEETRQEEKRERDQTQKESLGHVGSRGRARRPAIRAAFLPRITVSMYLSPANEKNKGPGVKIGDEIGDLPKQEASIHERPQS